MFGRLGANDQHAAHAVRRRRVVDGPIAIGPVDLFELAVAGDGDEMVLSPGRPASRHDLLDLRPDDGPDLRPHLPRRLAERRGMTLAPDRLAIGVVIEAIEDAAPPYIHRMAGVQDQAHGGAQRLRPGLRPAQRMRRPIIGPHEGAHFPSPSHEVWRRILFRRHARLLSSALLSRSGRASLRSGSGIVIPNVDGQLWFQVVPGALGRTMRPRALQTPIRLMNQLRMRVQTSSLPIWSSTPCSMFGLSLTSMTTIEPSVSLMSAP